MISSYTPTPFSEALMTWLKGTKCLPQFSRKLANFVIHRKAFRVIRLIPNEKTPDYALVRYDRTIPLGRYNQDFVYLTDVKEGHPWRDWPIGSVPRRNHAIQGTSLSTARRDGGTAGMYTTFLPMEEWDWEDCTLDFWERYMKLGRCLFDYKHVEIPPMDRYVESKHRWIMLDEQTAQCRWCGDILHLHRRLVVDVHARTTWTHEEPRPGHKTFRCRRCHRPHLAADMHQHLDRMDISSNDLCPSCFMTHVAETPTCVAG